MTEPDAILMAAARERRRLIIIFAATLALVTVTLGVGWASAWYGRETMAAQAEAWQDQALFSQGQYADLYGEFQSKTGDEPEAPDPDAVADSAPDPIPGPAGVPGERGPRGFPGSDGADGLAGIDGEDGADSTVPGPQGIPGTDSTVPGPQGATGPQGDVGPKGETGAPGPQGVGITSVTCQENGDWTFTLTDQTTITVPGPCRVDPILEGATP